MHTQIDLRGNIPSFIYVSDGKMHEVSVLDLMTPEPGSFTIMDRRFLDFMRLYRLTQAGAFFVIRPKSNTAFQRVYSRPVDKTTGLRCDQTVRLTGVKSPDDYPQYLRYVVFYDEKTDKRLGFFTNNFELSALTIILPNFINPDGKWNSSLSGSSSTCESRLSSAPHRIR